MLQSIITHEYFYHYLISILLVIVLIIVISSLLVKNRQYRKFKRTIKQISCDYLEKVNLDQGMDQYAEFDFLVLSDASILILELKDFAGHIFASENINEWTQVINNKSYKFENPFFELQRKIEMLRVIAGDVPVKGIIVFTEGADFPKGQPGDVLISNQVQAEYKIEKHAQALPAVREAWDRLKATIKAQSNSA